MRHLGPEGQVTCSRSHRRRAAKQNSGQGLRLRGTGSRNPRFSPVLTRTTGTSDLHESAHHTPSRPHPKCVLPPSPPPTPFHCSSPLDSSGRVPAVAAVIVRAPGALKRKMGDMRAGELLTVDRKSSAETPQESQTDTGRRAAARIPVHADLPGLGLNPSHLVLFPEVSKWESLRSATHRPHSSADKTFKSLSVSGPGSAPWCAPW